MKIWDAYDSSFKKIEGKTLIRGETIPDGMFHLVVSVLVRHADGSYLLMKRDLKKHYGGMWEASAGGSALAGETPMMCAVRELREETGISATQDNFTELKSFTNFKHNTIYVHFLCETDCKKDGIVLQPDETIDYLWTDRAMLLDMLENGIAVPSIVSSFLVVEI